MGEEYKTAVEAVNKAGTTFWREFRWYIVAAAIVCLGLVALGFYLGS